MSLFRIAWRSIQQRGVASLLTALSMALGVLLVVVVLVIHGVVSDSFRSNASLGYNMIVGAKGGKLQLTLNTVYYLSQPIQNVPYEYYLEFKTAEERRAELGDPGDLDLDRDGEFGRHVEFAIPLCLGDYVGRFRAVGTTPEFFEILRHGPYGDQPFEFAEGRNFRRHSPEHGFFEAVVGSIVAAELGFELGDVIKPAHGDPEGWGHDEGFTVVGILKPSATPTDRAVFVNMEGFFLMEGHAKPVEGMPDDWHRDPDQPLPIVQREVTAMLVRTADMAVTPILQDRIDSSPYAQAVLPVLEIYHLFDVIVRPVQAILLGLTAMVCVVSGISILVSIYNSMSDRRHEIAVMRALGAGRETVMAVILLESIVLSLGGGLVGWLLAHTLAVLANPVIEARTGVSIGFFDINLAEALLIPSLILLAILFGFFPAVSAYRTDVAKSLQ